MCRELRKKDILSEVLRLSHDRSLNKYADVDDEDDFQVFSFILLKVIKCVSQEVVEPPPIMPATTYQLTLAFPDFSQYKVIYDGDDYDNVDDDDDFGELEFVFIVYVITHHNNRFPIIMVF